MVTQVCSAADESFEAASEAAEGLTVGSRDGTPVNTSWTIHVGGGCCVKGSLSVRLNVDQLTNDENFMLFIKHPDGDEVASDGDFKFLGAMHVNVPNHAESRNEHDRNHRRRFR